MIASLYLVMVVVMVGMNYSLKQRTRRVGLRREAVEEAVEDFKSSEIRLTEGEALSIVVCQESDNTRPKHKIVNL